jgi:hypothetical protein
MKHLVQQASEDGGQHPKLTAIKIDELFITLTKPESQNIRSMKMQLCPKLTSSPWHQLHLQDEISF